MREEEDCFTLISHFINYVRYESAHLVTQNIIIKGSN